jgi:hypothetical protein
MVENWARDTQTNRKHRADGSQAVGLDTKVEYAQAPEYANSRIVELGTKGNEGA